MTQARQALLFLKKKKQKDFYPKKFFGAFFQKSTACLVLAAAFSGTAHAALVTKGMLIHACTAHDQRQVNDCAGYIFGITDMADSVHHGVCMPEGARLDQVRRRVSDWLLNHSTGNGPAAPAVVAALRHIYPCPN